MVAEIFIGIKIGVVGRKCENLTDADLLNLTPFNRRNHQEAFCCKILSFEMKKLCTLWYLTRGLPRWNGLNHLQLRYLLTKSDRNISTLSSAW